MNIFVLDDCPVISAEQMLDKHVVKMPTESMQMISTCLDHMGYDSPYRPVMLNHPCTIWARESKDNMRWLIRHTSALCKEYTKRYNKRHKVEDTLEEYLDNRSEAKQAYRQFLESFPGSAYAVEARRRFRILRGDELN